MRDKMPPGNDRERLCTMLFGKYYRMLVYFAVRLLGDDLLAEDIVQEAFLRLYESPAELRSDQAAGGYLFAVVRNKCLDTLKHQQVQRSYRSNLNIPPGEELIVASIVEAEAVSLLLDRIGQLPPECRKVMELVVEGISSVDIARELNLAPSTVRAQKRRGIKLLKELLPDELRFFLLFF